MICCVAHSDGCNGGGLDWFSGPVHREGTREKKSKRCEFCSGCEGEPGQVFLAVEAFKFAGCMFYFPVDFPRAYRLVIHNTSITYSTDGNVPYTGTLPPLFLLIFQPLMEMYHTPFLPCSY